MRFAKKAAAVDAVVVIIAKLARPHVHAILLFRSSLGKCHALCFQQSTIMKMSSAPMPKITKIPEGQSTPHITWLRFQCACTVCVPMPMTVGPRSMLYAHERVVDGPRKHSVLKRPKPHGPAYSESDTGTETRMCAIPSALSPKSRVWKLIYKNVKTYVRHSAFGNISNRFTAISSCNQRGEIFVPWQTLSSSRRQR